MKYRKREEKINQRKASVALSFSAMALGYAISIVYTPIMLRILGQSQYGLYNLVASVVSYLGLLNFGFSSAYIRYYSRYKVNSEKESIAKLNGMMVVVFSFIGLVAAIAGGILVLFSDSIFGSKLSVDELKTAKILLAIMVVNIAVIFPFNVFSSYIIANEEFIFQKIIQMVRTVISPFLMLPVLLLGYKSIGLVVATTVLSVIVEVSNAVFCFKKLKIAFKFRGFDFRLMKEMTIFSSFIFMNMIIDQINWNVDKFIIGRIRGTVAVAVYGIAAQLNSYYMSAGIVISSVFIPGINRMVATNNNNKELTELLARVGRIQFILLSLIFTGFIFFGHPFITMWAGTNYSEAYPIALIIIGSATIPLIQNVAIEIQKAKNMHHFRSWVYLFIAIGNIGISIPLTFAYGGVGAALGTGITLLIGDGIVMNWYYHYKVGLDMPYFWNQILRLLPALVLPALLGVGMVVAVGQFRVLSFLLCGAVYVLVFCISMWGFGMNSYEKGLIRRPIKKVYSKIFRTK